MILAAMSMMVHHVDVLCALIEPWLPGRAQEVRPVLAYDTLDLGFMIAVSSIVVALDATGPS